MHMLQKGEGRNKRREPHGNNNCDKSRTMSISIKEIKYFYCCKFGHMKKEYRKFKKEQLKQKGERQ